MELKSRIGRDKCGLFELANGKLERCKREWRGKKTGESEEKVCEEKMKKGACAESEIYEYFE